LGCVALVALGYLGCIALVALLRLRWFALGCVAWVT